MLSTIKNFFDTHLAQPMDTQGQVADHALRLAVAALLVEVADADYEQQPEERQVLLDSICQRFALDAEQARELLDLAQAEHAEATDYFQFTRLINQHYSAGQKVALIEALWSVAFADQQLHHYEEHVIRRLSELLHVPHADFIAAKHRVTPDRD